MSYQREPYPPAVLGIDPGPEKSAYCVWDGKRIVEKDILENSDILHMLGQKELNFRYGPGTRQIVHVTRLAVEMVCSFGMPVGASVFETVFWIGRFCQQSNLPHTRIIRKDIKMHICQNNSAKDVNIKQALIDRFAPNTKNHGKGSKKNPGFFYGMSKDMWQAFAVCVVFWDRYRT